MKKGIDKAALNQQWVHSHEEDTEREKVFRPSNYRFPPSRGRTGFALKPEGVVVETGPGPTDRPQEARGSWKMVDDDTLAFYEKGRAKPKRTMKILSLVKDKLVVKK